MKGLAPHTAQIFEAITMLDCIKDYTLVGGTALALQINARLSEDLDFMTWRTTKTDKREVDWPEIKRQLETIGKVELCDVLDLNHVLFIVDGVKISFYANPNYSPVRKRICFKNNLWLADKLSIGAMKMEVLLRRSKFRDYYDIYSLIEDGVPIDKMIDLALKYSNHRLKSKNLIAILTRSDRFLADSDFKTLSPRYDVMPQDIEAKIRSLIKG